METTLFHPFLVRSHDWENTDSLALELCRDEIDEQPDAPGLDRQRLSKRNEPEPEGSDGTDSSASDRDNGDEDNADRDHVAEGEPEVAYNGGANAQIDQPGAERVPATGTEGASVVIAPVVAEKEGEAKPQEDLVVSTDKAPIAPEEKTSPKEEPKPLSITQQLDKTLEKVEHAKPNQTGKPFGYIEEYVRTEKAALQNDRGFRTRWSDEEDYPRRPGQHRLRIEDQEKYLNGYTANQLIGVGAAGLVLFIGMIMIGCRCCGRQRRGNTPDPFSRESVEPQRRTQQRPDNRPVLPRQPRPRSRGRSFPHADRSSQVGV